MSVEELKAEYKDLYGKEAAGPHKNKQEWLEKKIAEAKASKDETVGEPKPEAVKAGFGFELRENVSYNGKEYKKDVWVDESEDPEGILKQYAK